MPLILTCDVEDWLQAYTHNNPVTDRVLKNIEKTIELLETLNVKCTFFVLGNVADKYPEIVKLLFQKGHDIQSHGYSHYPVNQLSPDSFRRELMESIESLGKITNKPIIGFRAPAFSIGKDSSWIYDILLECGFKYDSSHFPIKMRRYGFRNGFTKPYIIRRQKGVLIEFPIAVTQIFSLSIPIGGGGYLRYIPTFIFGLLWKKQLIRELPHILYFHPYDLNPDDFAGIEDKISLFLRFSQTYGRGTVAPKIAVVRNLAGSDVMTLSEFYLKKAITE